MRDKRELVSNMVWLWLAAATIVIAGCAAPIDTAPESDAAVTQAALSVADCPSGYNIVVGTAAIDHIYGSAGNDCLVGLAGNDVMQGLGGDDVLIGGDGNDSLRGGDGADRIYGEAGDDTLYGDAGNDVVVGGDNVDRAYGGGGNDVIDGGNGNDLLYGDAGSDAVIGGAGSNTINGGAGTDACTGSSCERPTPVPTGCTQSSQCTESRTCVVEVGICFGCASDLDGDLSCDPHDGCPNDAAKAAPGACGCGVSDVDSDADGTPNCIDGCPSDNKKAAAGVCGCGISDIDSDGDATPNCIDGCRYDATKIAPGICGCGVSDFDGDGDTVADCNDQCPGFDDTLDADLNGIPDNCQTCSVDSDCVAECYVATCEVDECVYAPQSPGEPCAGGTCDGTGTCLRIAAINAGPHHACGIRDQAPVCWGEATAGALNAPALTAVTHVAAGDAHSCAIDSGTITCWGTDGPYGEILTPPYFGFDAIEIDAAGTYTCAIFDDESSNDSDFVWCWGIDETGVTSPPYVTMPVQVETAPSFACAIHTYVGGAPAPGAIKCWGDNTYGQLQVPVYSGATDLAVGDGHACAVARGAVTCWGRNQQGEATPPFLSNPTQIAAGRSHSCALDNTGVVCWGNNASGQISVPADLGTVVELEAGGDYTCARTESGWRCWGDNASGQLNVP
jgi:hypothetical protein